MNAIRKENGTSLLFEKSMFSCLMRFMNIMPLIFLIPCSITDFRKKKISMKWCLIGGLGAIGYQLFCKKQQILFLGSSLSIGIILLVIAKISRQSIGYGDGIVFLVLGMWIGIWNSIVLLLFALIGSSIVSLFLILVIKKKKTYKIAFIPFVLAAYIMLEFIAAISI